MLKTVDIQNFQSHKNTHLDLTNGVNSIIGISNHGKTSILRAINWVITNRPSGEAFVSNFVRDEKGNQKEDCIVTLTTDTHVVSRVRGAKRNLYILDGKELEAIGMAVPQEIQDALNFSTVNIQAQMEMPFLLASTAGEVAQFFNRIVHLDTIDTYLSDIESKKRATKSELELARTNLKSTEDDLAKYDWVDRAQELMAKLKDAKERSTALFAQYEQLRQSIKAYQEYAEIIEQSSVVDKAITILEHVKDCKTRQQTYLQEYHILHDSISSYKEFDKFLQSIQFIDKAVLLLGSLETLQKRRDALRTTANNLASLMNDFIRNQKDIESASCVTYAEKLIKKISGLQANKVGLKLMHSNLWASIEEYKLYQQTLDAFEGEFAVLKSQLPATCPSCGQPLSADYLAEHVGASHG